MLSETGRLGSFKQRSLKSEYGRVEDQIHVPQTRRRATSILLDTWLPEVGSLIFSILCFGSIIGVLRAYDNHPLPSLPHGITLNAVISILATGAKSALLAAVASAIGQGKWTWFQSQPRPLEHAQILDEASRGPYGCLAMLSRRTAFSLPAIGAIITVLSLAVDPFIQQILTTSIRQVPEASDLAITTQATAFLNPEILSFERAINNAVYTDSFERTPGCPSGYSTELTWEVAPNGAGPFGLQVTTEVLWLVDDGNSTTNATFNNPAFLGIESPQSVLGHVSMAFDDDAAPEKGFHVSSATQCVLSYCVRDYDIKVDSGVVSVSTGEPNFGAVYETTVNDQPMACWTADPVAKDQMNYSNVSTTVSFPSQQQTITYYDLVDREHFTFCSSKATSIAQGLGLVLGGWGASIGAIIGGSRQSGVAFSEAGVQEMDYFGTTADASHDVFTYLSTTGGLNKVMPRLADSLTSLTLALPNRTQPITGLALRPEVFVDVRWQWLSLPLALCVGAAVFLALTASATRIAGVGIWKGSSLAYLYHGLEQHPASFESYDTASSMQSSAGSTMVSLRFSEKTARVCLT
ncbi:hypothetical protein H2200_010145 [Cladophialophora chaetospira]|uniref:Uncharacterized protein n=1 Tax=Cladophialophora chaetospira TaxID=386627 RepID=A0AA38X2F2_9EURO|nr:hypothetical protein H2200_010145 [Cladophialophora chaetospira]